MEFQTGECSGQGLLSLVAVLQATCIYKEAGCCTKICVNIACRHIRTCIYTVPGSQWPQPQWNTLSGEIPLGSQEGGAQMSGLPHG